MEVRFQEMNELNYSYFRLWHKPIDTNENALLTIMFKLMYSYIPQDIYLYAWVSTKGYVIQNDL